ncbi:MAG: acyltransferase [Clostridia bacterium]|nr:acyltransferase [Clostridia bacterium]
MIIGALQLNVVKNDKVKNLDTVERLIDHSAEIIVLPELFSTGYFFETVNQYKKIAEEIPNGYTTKRLCDIARKANSHLVGAIVETESAQLYITAIVVGPSGYIGKQRKRHLTNRESNFFTFGESSEIFNINGCKVGVIVCLEGWFPESARELMLKGAQIICHTALTCQERTLDIMRVRAIENNVYLIAANSITTENCGGDSITFRGDSRVIDYNGNILINAGREEKLIAVEVDESKTVSKDLEDCKDLISEVKKHKYFCKEF